MKAKADKRLLNARLIDTLTLPAQGYKRVTDTKVPALVLVVYHSGRKQFKHRYRRNGANRWYDIGQWPDVTLAVARECVQLNTAKMIFFSSLLNTSFQGCWI